MNYFGGTLENENAEKHANSGSLPSEVLGVKGTVLVTGLEVTSLVFCQRFSKNFAYVLKV